MAHVTSTHGSARAAAPRGSLFSFVAHAFSLSAQRANLANMDSTQLTDLGLTRTQARAESRRPFWDVPAGWKC